MSNLDSLVVLNLKVSGIGSSTLHDVLLEPSSKVAFQTVPLIDSYSTLCSRKAKDIPFLVSMYLKFNSKMVATFV